MQDTADCKALRQEIDHLRASRMYYKQIVQSANSIILCLNVDGTITFVNDFGVEFFGYTREELLGENLFDTILPDETVESWMSNYIKNPDRYNINENENTTKTGRKVWISWTNKPLYDEKGSLEEIISIGNDITLRREMEDARELIIEELQVVTNKVERLKELIPICSSCKKIRSDKGYWQRLEEFLAENLDIDISSSICPDCIKDLYPESYQDIIDSKE